MPTPPLLPGPAQCTTPSLPALPQLLKDSLTVARIRQFHSIMELVSAPGLAMPVLMMPQRAEVRARQPSAPEVD